MKKVIITLLALTMSICCISLIACKSEEPTHAHTFGEASYVWSDDNSTCTATRICSADETHKETETATASSAEKTPADCVNNKVLTYTATFSNEAFTVQTKDVEVENTATGNHNYVDGDCSVCGDWDGETSNDSWYVGHDNDEQFFISKTSQLLGLRDLVNSGNEFEGKTIVLENNIDLKELEWTPIGNGKRSGISYEEGYAFKGIFDGKDYTIKNLKITTYGGKDLPVGLFGVVAGGTVKNIKIENINITGEASDFVGSVVGELIDGGIVENVIVESGSITVKEAGGIVGRVMAYGTIRNCENNATITATGKAGGITAAAYYTEIDKVMTISNCTNNGAITSTAGFVGGIVGLSSAKIENCENTANITATSTSVGGIVGEQQNFGSITGCVNKGVINVSNAGYGIGGIVGWIRYSGSESAYKVFGIVSVSNNVNEADVIATGEGTVGGIVGHLFNAGVVENNINKASNLKGSEFCAGIVGTYQNNKQPNGGIPETQATVSNNISITELESIEGTNKDLYVYDNTSGLITVENNTNVLPLE